MQKNNSIKISILIPTFNRETYLSTCIESFYNEIKAHNLFDDVEVVISDNNSYDNTKNIVEEFAKDQRFNLHYFKNEENIGAVNNIIRLVSYASNDISLMFGDDDLLVPDSLPHLFKILNNNTECEVYHFKCVQTQRIEKGMAPLRLTAFEAADKYFYNVGNFGVFAYRTKSAIHIVKKCSERLAGTCWPQTEIMFLQLLQSPITKPFLVCGLETSNSSSHSNNVVYTSWYLAETTGFSLMRVAQNISEDYGDEFSIHARRSIPLIENFKGGLRVFLLHSVFIDYANEVAKTNELIKANLLLLKPPFRKYIALYDRIFHLPKSIQKFVYNFTLLSKKPWRYVQIFSESRKLIKNNVNKKKDDFDRRQANKTLNEKYLY